MVVAGTAQTRDGKTVAGKRHESLDGFAIAWLRRFVAMIAEERAALGDDYPGNPYVMVGTEDGRRTLADSSSRRPPPTESETHGTSRR